MRPYPPLHPAEATFPFAVARTGSPVNSQAAAREIWVAAKSGGYHFRSDGVRWVNTRDGSELFAALSTYVSQQSGETVNLATGSG